jgi:hypothetical protein
MKYRSATGITGGVRMILLWQGEGDAADQLDQVTYNSRLDTLANSINSDLSVKVMPCKFQHCTGIATSYQNVILAAIAEAWGDNTNIFAGPDLSDIDSDDSAHITTNTKLVTIANRWATSIITALGW